MNHITMYGIPNCNSIKKAKDWLNEHAVSFEFHNYKKEGIDEARLQAWCEDVSWEVLLNKRGTTWRKLDDADKEDINQTKAIALMVQNPSMIKRPVLVVEGQSTLVGFDEHRYQAQLVGNAI